MASRSPALAGASGMMRPPPWAAMTSTTVLSVTGSAKACMKAASEARRMRRASACHEATPVRKSRGGPG